MSRKNNEVREHNNYCSDDEIIWCDCAISFKRFDWCDSCGGALPGILLLTDKVPNDNDDGETG